MPRIQLKPKSPEFADAKPARKTRHCEMPGCSGHGDHRAPKDRSLSGHYWFCIDHVREYNAAWDFFSGMNPREVEDHILKSLYGDRPTWKYGVNGEDPADALRTAAWRAQYFREDEPPKTRAAAIDRHSPEFEALVIFGLEPPVDMAAIKARYKELAKKHHPDLNRHNPEAEELLKRINMAYTILKLAGEKFSALQE
jgi:hypothetical protein